MIEKRLGRIERADFGIAGYQDAMLGLHVWLVGAGWGVSTTKSAWDCNIIKPSEHCAWTEDDRSLQYDEIVRYVSGVLRDAKVSHVPKLAGKPVEATFEDKIIQSWRILTEVL